MGREKHIAKDKEENEMKRGDRVMVIMSSGFQRFGWLVQPGPLASFFRSDGGVEYGSVPKKTFKSLISPVLKIPLKDKNDTEKKKDKDKKSKRLKTGQKPSRPLKKSVAFFFCYLSLKKA